MFTYKFSHGWDREWIMQMSLTTLKTVSTITDVKIDTNLPPEAARLTPEEAVQAAATIRTFAAIPYEERRHALLNLMATHEDTSDTPVATRLTGLAAVMVLHASEEAWNTDVCEDPTPQITEGAARWLESLSIQPDPPTRISSATFSGEGTAGLDVVLRAFCKPFPSLSGLPGMAEELLTVAAGPGETEEAARIEDNAKANLRQALAASENAYEWPGDIEVVDTSMHRIGPELVEDRRQVVLRPWTGDRVLRLEVDGPTWQAVADYTERPSERAAEHVLALIAWTGMMRATNGTWIRAGGESIREAHRPEAEGSLRCTAVKPA